jgi:hypothetical protein
MEVQHNLRCIFCELWNLNLSKPLLTPRSTVDREQKAEHSDVTSTTETVAMQEIHLISSTTNLQKGKRHWRKCNSSYVLQALVIPGP